MSQQAQIDLENSDLMPRQIRDAIISTGYSDLDAILPEGGWPFNDLVEMISTQWGTRELQLVLPLMKSVIDQGKWVLWIAPPYIPCAPSLVSAGVDISRVIAVHTQSSCREALSSIDQALKNEGCGMVIAWLDWLPNSVVRRIQHAARMGKKLGVLFRQYENKLSPAVLRLQLKPKNNGLSVIRLKAVLKAQGDCHRDHLHDHLKNRVELNFPV